MNTDTPETDSAYTQRPNEGAWDFRIRQEKTMEKLERERDEAQEYADRLAEGLPDGMLPKDVEVLREANLGLATELAAVTEQRDRLAEALETIIITGSAQYCRERAYEALQSLTTQP